jgi:hypothetical protein
MRKKASSLVDLPEEVIYVGETKDLNQRPLTTHNLINTGSETITCLITFSSGDRQTVFVE